jgi:peroxiredoxin Q/BCP
MKKPTVFVMGLMAAAAAYCVGVGDLAPAIKAKDQDGNTWERAERQGDKHLVVYFYPAAMTGGCTKQACAYRDHLEAAKGNFMVVGISGDAPQNLKWFQTAENLNFTLLSDPEGAIAKAFGVPVKAGVKTITRTVEGKEVELTRSATAARWTFIIDPHGKVVYRDDQVKPLADLENVTRFLSGSE